MSDMELVARYHFDIIDSTNKEARRYARSGGDAPALFVANGQSEGRGRLGRSFYSPVGTGLYMTLLMDVTADRAESITRLTSLAAVAVTDALREVTNISSRIKWVNDIYIDGKKVCGILAESFFEADRRYVALGVGINLDTSVFPADISDIAGNIGVRATDSLKARLSEAVAKRILRLYALAEGGDLSYMVAYRERSAVLGRRVTFSQNGESREGVAVSVNDDGGLEVRLDNGCTVLLSSGEITVRLKDV